MLNSLRRYLDQTAREVLRDDPAHPVPDARKLTEDHSGSGIFGQWRLDAEGLPAYHYTLDQYADPRAKYPNSLNLDRRDHWYPIGNDRITALVSNDGTIQFYMADRGGTLLNRFDDGAGPDDWIDALTFIPIGIREFIRNVVTDLRYQRLEDALADWRTSHPSDTNKTALADTIRQTLQERGIEAIRRTNEHEHYSGGFGYVHDGTEAWATAFKYRPKGATVRRVFGLGYFETESNYRNIRVTRRTYAPFGNDPVLLSDVNLRNTSDQPITIRYSEYWDVNHHQLRANWFQTGMTQIASTDAREAINESFTQSVKWDAHKRTLRTHFQPIAPNLPLPQESSAVDYFPSDVFLADLSNSPLTNLTVYTDKHNFFGNGSPSKPQAISERQPSTLLSETSAYGQPFLLVVSGEITLQPGEIKQLRFAYGAARPESDLSWVEEYRHYAQATTTQRWKDHLAYFSTGGNPALQREMVWHSYGLQVNSVYYDYYKTHAIAQGSAYQFLHGFDGAPRDQALFVLPLSYIRPQLAKDTLKLIMSVTKAKDGYMSYGYSGYGVLENAVIHTHPSDLDLFFLLGVTEYLAVTGDYGFLDERVPYYPAGQIPEGAGGDTVLDHIRYAYHHLFNVVGVGENGLIKVGDGDWSDAIVIESAAAQLFVGVSFDLSVQHGESIPNTQMAVYILTQAANVIEARDPSLADQMRNRVPGLRQALAGQWNGQWYNRAILRNAVNSPVVMGKYQINLEAQPWALISGVADADDTDVLLINSIQTRLDANAPTGAPYLERGAQVSAAITQLLTWGYSRSRPDLAWTSLLKMSFANHAAHFPENWIGIWTAPDSINPTDGKNPGGTWMSPVTPMTDFPAMNANPHAMSLLAMIRLAGLEPLADGLRIAPRIPKEAFTLDLPLIKIMVAPTGVSGEYRAHANGRTTLYIEIPDGMKFDSLTVKGQSVTPETFGGYVIVPLSFKDGERIGFDVVWSKSVAESVQPAPVALLVF